MDDSIQKVTKVVVCGEKRVAEQCLEYLENRQDTKICAIVASPNDWQANLIQWGMKRRIKVFVGNINDYYDEIVGLKSDFVFSIQYRPLIKPQILGIPTQGCINLHFGLLPRYGGCYPIAWAILNGESEAGATLHYMVPSFDEGDVIGQAKVPINTETTARELFDSVSEAAAKLFASIYPRLRNGNVESIPQDLSRKLYYTKHSIDFERDHFIDWNRPGPEIQRRICAFSFEPFQLPSTFLRLPSGREIPVTVAKTRLCNDESYSANRMPGEIMAVGGSGHLLVASAEGAFIEIGLVNKEIPEDFLKSTGYSIEDLRFVSNGGTPWK
jgi:methionyl-tRNA formyltransferase